MDESREVFNRAEIIERFTSQAKELIQTTGDLVAVLDRAAKDSVTRRGINLEGLAAGERTELVRLNLAFFDQWQKMPFLQARQLCHSSADLMAEFEHDSAIYVQYYETAVDLTGLNDLRPGEPLWADERFKAEIGNYLPWIDAVFVKQAKVVLESYLEELGVSIPPRELNLVELVTDAEKLFIATDLVQRNTGEVKGLKKLQIIVHSPAGPVWFTGHESRLRRVINNIVGNAVKAVKNVRTDRIGQVDITINPGKEASQVSVVDNGCGVNTENTLQGAVEKGLLSEKEAQKIRDNLPSSRSRIFEIITEGASGFAQEGRGTGLGLLACKTIMTGLNSRMSIFDRRDRQSGTEVDLMLKPAA